MRERVREWWVLTAAVGDRRGRAAHTVPDHPKNLLYSGPVVLILFRQLRRYGLAMLLLKPLNIMPEKVEKHIYWTLVRIWPVLTEQRQGRNQG